MNFTLSLIYVLSYHLKIDKTLLLIVKALSYLLLFNDIVSFYDSVKYFIIRVDQI